MPTPFLSFVRTVLAPTAPHRATRTRDAFPTDPGPGRVCRAAAAPVLVATAALLLPSGVLSAQQKLRALPGYAHYQEMVEQIRESVVPGALDVEWAEDGSSFEYRRDGARYRYDVEERAAVEVGPVPQEETPGSRGRRGPARGRQYEEAESPDGSRVAFYRDRNLYIRNADGSEEVAVTTEGSEADRTKFGTASWVYGEELNQNTAMWWAPDGSKLAYYGFDEGDVRDYYLQMDQTEVHGSLDVEAYPKAGTTNPVVSLWVYDLAEGSRLRIDARDGRPLTDDVVGHYVYGIEWTPDGEELLIRRTNRRQNVMELAACSPVSGSCRTVVREEWPASWTRNSPYMEYLSDGERFLWMSERSGWRNLYLYDLSGDLLATVTDLEAEVVGVERIDESAGVVWYTARDGDNHMMVQLHRVGLDGSGDVRLTDPALNHSVEVAPDGRHFVDVAQTHDRPPSTRLVSADGEVLDVVAESDLTRFDELGLRRVELFEFTAADGTTRLHGMLHRPSDFDPGRSYSVLVSVYGGPRTNGARETFTTPHPFTELGFLVVTMDSRSAAGRGKAFTDAIYESLGVVEIDDQAEGIRELGRRPYVDGSRVGIFGTSYGGYFAVMAILRHPDLFHAASASSPVTDWRHYDTIYTERYMWTPQGNGEGYDAGSAMTYADRLEGDLLLYYGTADNNVHPNNTMQLIAALQAAEKSFEVQVGPDRGHSAVSSERMLEFFVESLEPATALAGRAAAGR